MITITIMMTMMMMMMIMIMIILMIMIMTTMYQNLYGMKKFLQADLFTLFYYTLRFFIRKSNFIG